MNIHPKSIYKKSSKEEIVVFYKKESDQEILDQIKPIIAARPTYGYKRVTRMVNRVRLTLDLPIINKKRVYRIMKINGLLLPKSEITRIHRATGKVMTLHSNTRWCSDCFEIKCFNGEKVYVAFIVDSCDRSIISYLASDRPILAEDIQQLMLEAVEKRFKGSRAARTIEFLSDRGSIYRAYNVQSFARQLNLKSCFTAAYSPESNGMSESLVNTIKRDYVYVNDCVDAPTVIKMIPYWIIDYNEVAPHSSLKMMTPQEFYRSREAMAAGFEQDAKTESGQQPGWALGYGLNN
jgi:putative transposase